MGSEQELLAALQQPPEPIKVSRIDEVLAQLSATVRAGFEAALANPAWSAGAIRQVLMKANHQVAESTIRRYRKDRYGV